MQKALLFALALSFTVACGLEKSASPTGPSAALAAPSQAFTAPASPSAVCYDENGQPYYCTLPPDDDPPYEPPPPPEEPADGQLGQCNITPDGCSYYCLTYSRLDHQYHEPAIEVANSCY